METVEKPNLQKLGRSLVLYAGIIAALISCKSSEQYKDSRSDNGIGGIEIVTPNKEKNIVTHNPVNTYTKKEIADTMQIDNSDSCNIGNTSIEDSITKISEEEKQLEERYSDIKVQKIQQDIAQNHKASIKHLTDPDIPSRVIEAIAKTLAEHHPKYFEKEKETIKGVFLEKKEEEVKGTFGNNKDIIDIVMHGRSEGFDKRIDLTQKN